MKMISFFIWDGSRELFSFGIFTLRWNTLMLILAFIASQQILSYIYRKENNSVKDVSVLITCLIISVLVGARLGYVFLYEPELILSRPAEIFLPFEFQPRFRFTGTEGLSIHGGLAGILIGIWLYCRKKRAGQSYLVVLDRVSIIALVASVFLFIGSFLNSEIIGKPTDSSLGTIFIKPVTRGISNLPCCIMRNPNGKNPLASVSVIKNPEPEEHDSTGYRSIVLYMFFSEDATEQLVNEFLIGDVKNFLFDMPQIVSEPGTEPLHFNIFIERDGRFAGRVRTFGIARYPVQLFEALCCLAFVIFSIWYWQRKKSSLRPGEIFALSMLMFWSLHFAFGFIKENSFDTLMGLSRDQVFSIPFLVLGVVVWLVSRKRVMR